MILCTSNLARPAISKELFSRKLLKAKLSSPGPRNGVGVPREQQIFRANSEKIGRLSNYDVGRDEIRSRGLSETISETFEWCKLALPLLLAVCGTYLFRGYIKENRFPVHPHTAVYASISKSTVDPNYSWKDVINYRFQKIMGMQMFGKLMAVFFTAIPIVVVGGILYKFMTGRPFRESLFRIYTVTSHVPGTNAVRDDNTLALFISNLVFFLGTLTVAVTLGIVCDDVSNIVQTVRNGNYQIVEQNHVVILNTNNKLKSVFRQMAIAARERGSFSGPIVVMDDKDKGELDSMVANAAEGLNLSIMTRKGCTHDLISLRKVAAGYAKHVIWLEPEGDEISVAARRAASIAALKSLGIGQKNPATMVVQTSEDSVSSKSQLTSVSLAYRSPPLKPSQDLNVIEIYDDENLDRMLAQCALQPNISEIMEDILQQNEGKEFYITEAAEFEGQTYRQARRRFTQAIVCGIYIPSPDNIAENGVVRMNPPDDTVLTGGEKFVVLANNLWSAKPSAEELPPPTEWSQAVCKDHTNYQSENILVLCFGRVGSADSGLIESLERFVEKPTNVTLVAKSYDNRGETRGKCKLKFVKGDPTAFRTLKKFEDNKIDAVVLAGLEDLDPKVADAQVISSLIQIQEAANMYWTDKRGFNFVSPVNSPETRIVAENMVALSNSAFDIPINLNMILPTQLSSGVLIQVAGYPHLNLVFKSLLNESGSELYIRGLDDFDLVGRGNVKAYEVADLARTHGETFLGFIRKDGTFTIAPDAYSEREYVEGERIVVLAESASFGYSSVDGDAKKA